MKKTVLHIKNMVCARCIKVVDDELSAMGCAVDQTKLGIVELATSISEEELERIRIRLQANGFELLDDKRTKLIERVKILILEGIRSGAFAEMNQNLSDYLSEALQVEYTHLSSLFSSVEGKSIERYAILQKIERIKELITYNELSVKEIAYQLGYSSLQALSSQFKKETGLTPTEFKNLTDHQGRRSIDGI